MQHFDRELDVPEIDRRLSEAPAILFSMGKR